MINVKNYILIFLRFTAIFFSLNCYGVYAHNMPPVLVNQDFTVQMEDETVTLGERWTDDVALKIEVPIEGYFVGEVPFDGTHYKFYQHQKAGFDIYVSNLWWDKVERNADDYIVSQITLTAGEGKTPRGIHVGSTARNSVMHMARVRWKMMPGNNGIFINWVTSFSRSGLKTARL